MSAQKQDIKVGRRKTAIARVFLSNGSGKISVNGKDVASYFTVPRMLKRATEGLVVAGEREKYDVHVRVTGGGISGQAGATRLAIARALQEKNSGLRSILKKAGMFRRDPRMVERKKYGLHKARRGTQFSKR